MLELINRNLLKRNWVRLLLLSSTLVALELFTSISSMWSLIWIPIFGLQQFLSAFKEFNYTQSQDVPHIVNELPAWLKGTETNDGLIELSKLTPETLKLISNAHQVALNVAIQRTKHEVSSQIGHDLHSPLSALNMAVNSITQISMDEKLLLKNATLRINDIANGLSQTSTSSMEARDEALVTEAFLLPQLLENIISDKRTRYRDRLDIELHSQFYDEFGLFADGNPYTIHSYISDFLERTINSIDLPTKIQFSLSREQTQSLLNIQFLPKISTFNLPSRLLRLKDSIEKDFCEFSSTNETTQIESTCKIDNHSLIVTIRIPMGQCPEWFPLQILVPPSKSIISIDDDKTIHQVWDGRFGNQETPIEHLNFLSIESFEKWIQLHQSKAKESLFLVDYEFLGSDSNGLELIGKWKLNSQSVLVSSRYDNPEIKARALKMGVKILPKVLAPYIPITDSPSEILFDAVLIDDDPLIHMAWKIHAKNLNKNIRCYRTAQEFFSDMHEINVETPIFIDVNLSDGVRGESVADNLREAGFKKIALATGFSKSEVQQNNSADYVVGKDPNFNLFKSTVS